MYKIPLVLFSFFIIVPKINSQVSSASEELIHSTVRIECTYSTQNLQGQTITSSGTGSAFIFAFKEGDLTVPVLVTNKHVIKNSTIGKFQFTKADTSGQPLYGQKYPLTISDFENKWILHPDPNVDLCVMPIGAIINNAISSGTPIFHRHFEESLIPSEADWQNFTAIEEITMIGYPIGLWDSVNNVPIVRSGQTATPLKIDYLGKEEFLIDIPAFPGSSGSPVILFNQGAYSSENGINLGSRLYLLGTLYAGPIFNAEGVGRIQNQPVNVVTSTGIPINIGIAIKSTKILDFKTQIMALAR